MTPADIKLPDMTYGDTWEGLSIGPVLFNGEQPPESLSSCRLYFRNAGTRDMVYGYKSEPSVGFGSIIITDPVAWRIDIPAQPLPAKAGACIWNFETTDAAGVVRTLYTGSIRIQEDITYD